MEDQIERIFKSHVYRPSFRHGIADLRTLNRLLFIGMESSSGVGTSLRLGVRIPLPNVADHPDDL